MPCASGTRPLSLTLAAWALVMPALLACENPAATAPAPAPAAAPATPKPPPTDAELVAKLEPFKSLASTSMELQSVTLGKVIVTGPPGSRYQRIPFTAQYRAGSKGCLGTLQPRPVTPSKPGLKERRPANLPVATIDDVTCLDWEGAPDERLGAPCVAVANAYSEECRPLATCALDGAAAPPGKAGRCSAQFLVRPKAAFSVEGVAGALERNGEWAAPVVFELHGLEAALRSASEPLDVAIATAQRALRETPGVVVGKTGFLVPEAPKVLGQMLPEVVEAQVQKLGKPLLHCYEAELAKRPLLRGTVTLRLTIDGDGVKRSDGGGRVQAKEIEDGANAASAAGENAKLVACLNAVVVHSAFPKAGGGGSTLVGLPLRFEQVTPRP